MSAGAGIGNNFAKANLDQDLGSGTPATWYAALLTAQPTDGAGTGLAEVAYTGYARQAVTNNGTNFPAAGVTLNIATKTCQATITFPVVAGLTVSVDVTGIALFDASSGGNFGRTAVFGSPTAPATYTLNNGAQITIAAGNLSFQEV
jgi:hypothetical protein